MSPNGPLLAISMNSNCTSKLLIFQLANSINFAVNQKPNPPQPSLALWLPIVVARNASVPRGWNCTCSFHHHRWWDQLKILPLSRTRAPSVVLQTAFVPSKSWKPHPNPIRTIKTHRSFKPFRWILGLVGPFQLLLIRAVLSLHLLQRNIGLGRFWETVAQELPISISVPS